MRPVYLVMAATAGPAVSRCHTHFIVTSPDHCYSTSQIIAGSHLDSAGIFNMSDSILNDKCYQELLHRFSNGFYAKCATLFVGPRAPQQLMTVAAKLKKHQVPTISHANIPTQRKALISKQLNIPAVHCCLSPAGRRS